MKTVSLYLGILLMCSSCLELKQTTLFDQNSEERNLPHVAGFYAVNILKDQLSSEVWYTENAACLNVRQESGQVYAGKGAVYLKWDKLEGGCEWIGMGIGWDAWTGKNLEPILNKAAIQFKARIPKGKIQSLPLAVSLEDYAGNAAWLGIFPELIEYKGNEEWATVTLPLERFGWEEFGADPGNIKQMIIQFEAAGELWVDEIEIVAHEGLKNEAYVAQSIQDNQLNIDGDLSDWSGVNTLQIGEHRLELSFSENWMYCSGVICDDTPMKNTYSGKDVLKADGIEILLGLNPDASASRKQMLLSDQHMVIKSSEKPGVYDVRNEGRLISEAKIKMLPAGCGYRYECAIPMSYFGLGSIKPEEVYALEVAINFGQEIGDKKQLRWNSNQRKGYDQNPSLWGKMMLKTNKNPQ